MLQLITVLAVWWPATLTLLHLMCTVLGGSLGLGSVGMGGLSWAGFGVDDPEATGRGHTRWPMLPAAAPLVLFAPSLLATFAWVAEGMAKEPAGGTPRQNVPHGPVSALEDSAASTEGREDWLIERANPWLRGALRLVWLPEASARTEPLPGSRSLDVLADAIADAAGTVSGTRSPRTPRGLGGPSHSADSTASGRAAVEFVAQLLPSELRAPLEVALRLVGVDHEISDRCDGRGPIRRDRATQLALSRSLAPRL